jgi:diguanylate cyclase (GGDEF)-like protein
MLLIGASIVVFNLFFWYGLNQQQTKTAQVFDQNLRATLSEVAYLLSKDLGSPERADFFKAYLERIAATSDAIDALVLAQGSHVLLSTDPSVDRVPRRDEVILVSARELPDFDRTHAYETEVRYYQGNQPRYLRLYALLDRDYIRSRVGLDYSHLLLQLGLPPLLILLLLWWMLNRSLSRPLEALRQFAYYQSYTPRMFWLRELEAIRSSMLQTYQRLEQEKAELYKLSTTDSLSGLANRNSLDQRLSWLIAEASRNKQEFAVFFLDLDNFKSVNDSQGHKIGDQLLVMVAEQLREVIRNSDIIARVGGDEFVFVLSNYHSHLELTRIADRVLERLSQPWVVEGYQLFISGSIGIALYPKDGSDTVTLLKNADIAMYQAKKRGRNQYAYFTEEVNREIQHDITLSKEMRQGLEAGEFELHYQPQTDSFSGEITGIEALVRWNHPARGLIGPDRFIPLAERTGLIIDLGDWILREALRQQVEWRERQGIDLVMSVNISALQFHDDHFEHRLDEALKDSGADPERVHLEITETLLMRHADAYLDRLQRIHQRGFRFALDDFGTGFSSLAYLKTFPIDVLKIDRMFIRDHDTVSGAIFLETIVKMAHTLRLDVICEGVETAEQLDYLARIGCESYQGYYCSRPLPADEFLHFMRQRRLSLVGD